MYNMNINPKCSICRTYFVPLLKSSGLPFKTCERCRMVQKEFRLNNAENIQEYNKENNKEYNQNNAEKIQERNKEYYQNNADKLKEQKKEYYLYSKPGRAAATGRPPKPGRPPPPPQ